MSLRRKSLRRLGVTPLIISLMSSRSAYNDLHYGWKVIGVDGFTCFQPPIVGSPEPYKQYVGEAIPWMKATMSPPKAAPQCGSSLYALWGDRPRSTPLANERHRTRLALDCRYKPQSVAGASSADQVLHGFRLRKYDENSIPLRLERVGRIGSSN